MRREPSSELGRLTAPRIEYRTAWWPHVQLADGGRTVTRAPRQAHRPERASTSSAVSAIGHIGLGTRLAADGNPAARMEGSGKGGINGRRIDFTTVNGGGSGHYTGDIADDGSVLAGFRSTAHATGESLDR